MEIGAELFRRMAEASRDGLMILDDRGHFVYANHRLGEMLGSPGDLTGRYIGDFRDPVEREQLPGQLELLRTLPPEHEGFDDAEAKLVRADGSELWTVASLTPLRDDDGRRVAWVYRITDNTERKLLLESLRERERLLAAAQTIARIGSWSWDIASDTVTWSEQLYRIYNVEPAEFEATYDAFLQFIHPDDRQLVADAVGSIFAGADEFAWDGRVLRRGGEQRWVRGLGRVERGADGTPLRMGGTAQDITERVLADQQAAEATRRLHLLQAMATAANQTNSLDEALELAAVGLPEFTSWAAVGMHRVLPDGGLEFVGMAPDGDGPPPEPTAALAEACRASREVRFIPCPGRESTHSIVALPVVVDGETVCVVEVLADEIPPDDNSRTLIEQISAQLSQVAQRERSAVQLAEARDDAMEASRLKSEFLATMSHEIRTPMNGVIGLTDLLLRTELDTHQRRLAEGLQGAGLTLLAIINDILDLSKIEAGKLELEEVDFDVRAVLEKSAGVLAGPAAEKGVELLVSSHPDVPPQLRGDPGRLGQVVANLASNAVKFTDEGQVEVRAEVASADEERVLLRVTVADTGVGIDPADQPRLFDAFTQADPSTTRQHGGTGLGLAISQQLVSALGGTITVESQPGRGSTFAFTADLGRSATEPEPVAGAPDPAVLAGRRVLVVDDNETNRLILAEQLAGWGVEPVVATSSEEAMEAVRAAADDGAPFEVALLDLLLPDGDGLALARAIIAGTGDAAPRLVLLSSGGHVDTTAARAAGFGDTLTKPVRESLLLECLVSTLGAAPRTPEHSPQAGPSHRGRQRLLVVEDNEVNQMVAVGLLEGAGYAADVVADGEEAVAALRPGHGYAAVLMDCRMPRMDGFDATRAVRASETADERVPIIAMTASALEGEQERCLAAGMDDFLTKPVDPVRLLRVVRRWADGVSPDARDGSTPDAVPADPLAALGDAVDLDRMRMLDELRRDGVSLFDKASANFAENVEELRAELHAAVAAADAGAVTAAAHRLKGSATNLGLPALGEAAQALERRGDTGDVTRGSPSTTDLLGDLDTALSRALSALGEVKRHGL